MREVRGNDSRLPVSLPADLRCVSCDPHSRSCARSHSPVTITILYFNIYVYTCFMYKYIGTYIWMDSCGLYIPQPVDFTPMCRIHWHLIQTLNITLRFTENLYLIFFFSLYFCLFLFFFMIFPREKIAKGLHCRVGYSHGFIILQWEFVLWCVKTHLWEEKKKKKRITTANHWAFFFFWWHRWINKLMKGNEVSEETWKR